MATGHLLAEIGIDINAVRESIAADLTRRCPDREVLADALAETASWREAGEG